VELLTDDAIYRQISAEARSTALKRFCTDLVIPRYEAHYRRTLGA
jgi:hypothetical protein